MKRRHQRTLYFPNKVTRKVSPAAYGIAKRIVGVGMVDYGWLVLDTHEIPAAERLRELGYVEMLTRGDTRDAKQPEKVIRKGGMNVRWKAGVDKPRFKTASICALTPINGRYVRVSEAQKVLLKHLEAGGRQRLPCKYDKLGVMVRALERRGIVAIDWTDGVGDVTLAPFSAIPPPPAPPPVGEAVITYVTVAGPIAFDDLVDLLRADRPGMRRVVFANAVGAAVNAGKLKYVSVEGQMCLKLGDRL